MTVQQLIQLLEKYPPDTRVMVNGYETGFDDISAERVSIVKVRLNAGTERWEGKHEDAPSDDNEAIDALVIRRASN